MCPMQHDILWHSTGVGACIYATAINYINSDILWNEREEHRLGDSLTKTLISIKYPRHEGH